MRPSDRDEAERAATRVAQRPGVGGRGVRKAQQQVGVERGLQDAVVQQPVREVGHPQVEDLELGTDPAVRHARGELADRRERRHRCGDGEVQRAAREARHVRAFVALELEHVGAAVDVRTVAAARRGADDEAGRPAPDLGDDRPDRLAAPDRPPLLRVARVEMHDAGPRLVAADGLLDRRVRRQRVGGIHAVRRLIPPNRRSGRFRTARAALVRTAVPRPQAASPWARGCRYSHSMVPGGLDVMSSTTRLTSRSSPIMRAAICSSKSYGRRAQSAVIASSLVTARMTTTYP
jgi:hypothetical protein